MDETSPASDRSAPRGAILTPRSGRGRPHVLPPPSLEGSGRAEGEVSSPELDAAVAVMMASVDRLDELGLEAVEPATTFGWR